MMRGGRIYKESLVTQIDKTIIKTLKQLQFSYSKLDLYSDDIDRYAKSIDAISKLSAVLIKLLTLRGIDIKDGEDSLAEILAKISNDKWDKQVEETIKYAYALEPLPLQ